MGLSKCFTPLWYELREDDGVKRGSPAAVCTGAEKEAEELRNAAEGMAQ